MSKRIALIVETDFRDEEAIYPFYRLQEAGCIVDVVTDHKKQAFGKFGTPLQGTVAINELNADDYDGVVIPGGNEGPDRLRINPYVKEFVRSIYDQEKLVAAICHGPWVLISAKIMKGKNATCYKAIVDDLENAGAIYHDNPVIVDGNLITSRHPRDLAIFMAAVVKYLSES
jgi:protease I